jgi:hypothetical protein
MSHKEHSIVNRPGENARWIDRLIEMVLNHGEVARIAMEILLT